MESADDRDAATIVSSVIPNTLLRARVPSLPETRPSTPGPRMAPNPSVIAAVEMPETVAVPRAIFRFSSSVYRGVPFGRVCASRAEYVETYDEPAARANVVEARAVWVPAVLAILEIAAPTAFWGPTSSAIFFTRSSPSVPRAVAARTAPPRTKVLSVDLVPDVTAVRARDRTAAIPAVRAPMTAAPAAGVPTADAAIVKRMSATTCGAVLIAD